MFRPTEELYRQTFNPTQTIKRGVGFAGQQYLDKPETTELATSAPGAQAGAARELYARVGPSPEEQQEIQKSQIPLRQQEIAGQYGLAQKQEESAGALGVEQERQRGMQEQSRQLNELYRMMSGGGGQGISGVRMPTRSGGGGLSFRAEQRVPSALLRDVTAARNALEIAKRSNWIGDPYEETNVQQADAQYRAALGAVFSQDPADADIQEVAISIATDPDLQGLSTNEVLQHPKFGQQFDPSVFGPEDLQNLDRLLNYSRGAAGGAGF